MLSSTRLGNVGGVGADIDILLADLELRGYHHLIPSRR
jgi:hypothetical protein